MRARFLLLLSVNLPCVRVVVVVTRGVVVGRVVVVVEVVVVNIGVVVEVVVVNVGVVAVSTDSNIIYSNKNSRLSI